MTAQPVLLGSVAHSEGDWDQHSCVHTYLCSLLSPWHSTELTTGIPQQSLLSLNKFF